MKKMIGAFTIILLVLIGTFLYINSEQNTKQSVKYVVFPSHENLNDELRTSLVKRLEANKIPYQIDENGNVKIPENDVTNAVMCCS